MANHLPATAQPQQGYGAPQQGYAPPGAYAQPYPGYAVAPYDPQAKSKIVAGLLGIFLGGFGVHRFYLGYTKIGVIQIIVTIVTCGIGSHLGVRRGDPLPRRLGQLHDRRVRATAPRLAQVSSRTTASASKRPRSVKAARPSS